MHILFLIHIVLFPAKLGSFSLCLPAELWSSFLTAPSPGVCCATALLSPVEILPILLSSSFSSSVFPFSSPGGFVWSSAVPVFVCRRWDSLLCVLKQRCAGNLRILGATLETLVSVSDLETTSVCQSKMEQQVEFHPVGQGWERNKMLFFLFAAYYALVFFICAITFEKKRLFVVTLFSILLS